MHQIQSQEFLVELSNWYGCSKPNKPNRKLQPEPTQTENHKKKTNRKPQIEPTQIENHQKKNAFVLNVFESFLTQPESSIYNFYFTNRTKLQHKRNAN